MRACVRRSATSKNKGLTRMEKDTPQEMIAAHQAEIRALRRKPRSRGTDKLIAAHVACIAALEPTPEEREIDKRMGMPAASSAQKLTVVSHGAYDYIGVPKGWTPPTARF